MIKTQTYFWRVYICQEAKPTPTKPVFDKNTKCMVCQCLMILFSRKFLYPQELMFSDKMSVMRHWVNQLTTLLVTFDHILEPYPNYRGLKDVSWDFNGNLDSSVSITINNCIKVVLNFIFYETRFHYRLSEQCPKVMGVCPHHLSAKTQLV